MSKHTPGPWEMHGEFSGRDIVQIETKHGYSVADVRNYNRSEQNKANAKLIAAAPDLLEALQNLIGEVKDIRGVDVEEYKPAAFEQARAAIKKATS